jgi:Mor family transcriptional regulator
MFHDYWEAGLRLEDLAKKYNLGVSSVWRRLDKAKKTVQAALEGHAGA